MQKGRGHMELIDLDKLMDLWVEYYPKLDDEDRALSPLRAVHFLAPEKITVSILRSPNCLH